MKKALNLLAAFFILVVILFVLVTLPAFVLMLLLGGIASGTGWNIAFGYWTVFLGLWALAIIGRALFPERNG